MNVSPTVPRGVPSRGVSVERTVRLPMKAPLLKQRISAMA